MVYPLASIALAVDTNEILQFDQVVTNPCNGEDVHIVGRGHLVIREQGNHSTVHVNFQRLHGVGLTTGDRYVVSGGLPRNQTLHFPTDEGFVGTFVADFRIISQGSEGNWHSREVAHITVTPSGEVTSDFSFVSVRCRG